MSLSLSTGQRYSTSFHHTCPNLGKELELFYLLELPVCTLNMNYSTSAFFSHF